MRILLLFACVIASATANAHSLMLLGGATHESGLEQTSYAWAIYYKHLLGKRTFLSLGWINEGHLAHHHRDGPVVQFGSYIEYPEQHLSLSFSIGPYAYFDTALAEQGASYANDHGYGLVYSAGMSWEAFRPWFFHVHINRVETDTHIDTTRLLFGVGYQLEARNAPRPATAYEQRIPRSEITVFVGRTVLNSFQSENSLATAIEYRRGVRPHMDWTLTWLHEGGNHIIRRNGIATQLWMVRSFLHDKLVLGAGAGAYVVLDKENTVNGTDGGDENISGIVTLSAGYRIDSRWQARLSWNRIVTGYSRDTDVFLLGCGHRFHGW